MTNNIQNRIPSLLVVAVIYLNAEFADINMAYADNHLLERQANEDNAGVAGERAGYDLPEKDTVPNNAGIKERHYLSAHLSTIGY